MSNNFTNFSSQL